MFYFHHIPPIIQRLYNQRLWHIPSKEKVIYLTFDDGPHPSLTSQILDLLSKFRAKVTFFQLGSKIETYPSLHQRCIDEAHTIGNHGYDHLDALSISSNSFFDNIEKGAKQSNSNLFRPAYGRLPLKRKGEILQKYNVTMWDIMPGDFDDKLNITECTHILEKYIQQGSIIVLHENDKSKNKVIEILKWVLDVYSKEGYKFSALPNDQILKS